MSKQSQISANNHRDEILSLQKARDEAEQIWNSEREVFQHQVESLSTELANTRAEAELAVEQAKRDAYNIIKMRNQQDAVDVRQADITEREASRLQQELADAKDQAGRVRDSLLAQLEDLRMSHDEYARASEIEKTRLSEVVKSLRAEVAALNSQLTARKPSSAKAENAKAAMEQLKEIRADAEKERRRADAKEAALASMEAEHKARVAELEAKIVELTDAAEDSVAAYATINLASGPSKLDTEALEEMVGVWADAVQSLGDSGCGAKDQLQQAVGAFESRQEALTDAILVLQEAAEDVRGVVDSQSHTESVAAIRENTETMLNALEGMQAVVDKLIEVTGNNVARHRELAAVLDAGVGAPESVDTLQGKLDGIWALVRDTVTARSDSVSAAVAVASTPFETRLVEKRLNEASSAVALLTSTALDRVQMAETKLQGGLANVDRLAAAKAETIVSDAKGESMRQSGRINALQAQLAASEEERRVLRGEVRRVRGHADSLEAKAARAAEVSRNEVAVLRVRVAEAEKAESDAVQNARATADSLIAMEQAFEAQKTSLEQQLDDALSRAGGGADRATVAALEEKCSALSAANEELLTSLRLTTDFGSEFDQMLDDWRETLDTVTKQAIEKFDRVGELEHESWRQMESEQATIRTRFTELAETVAKSTEARQSIAALWERLHSAVESQEELNDGLGEFAVVVSEHGDLLQSIARTIDDGPAAKLQRVAETTDKLGAVVVDAIEGNRDVMDTVRAALQHAEVSGRAASDITSHVSQLRDRIQEIREEVDAEIAASSKAVKRMAAQIREKDRDLGTRFQMHQERRKKMRAELDAKQAELEAALEARDKMCRARVSKVEKAAKAREDLLSSQLSELIDSRQAINAAVQARLVEADKRSAEIEAALDRVMAAQRRQQEAEERGQQIEASAIEELRNLLAEEAESAARAQEELHNESVEGKRLLAEMSTNMMKILDDVDAEHAKQRDQLAETKQRIYSDRQKEKQEADRMIQQLEKQLTLVRGERLQLQEKLRDAQNQLDLKERRISSKFMDLQMSFSRMMAHDAQRGSPGNAPPSHVPRSLPRSPEGPAEDKHLG
ncbi:Chromosome partition protein Smc [Carpediemonas membranifera]|uniref:Chromosome partition protein Smc n=1 Tax=Carpediemonas membranifera TaxID=201153 RepID=A0A8J6AUN7_9EUKA|nr:Chromosome partition protein Smc [Carpediemonas membranifera]|eukprot:KAG9395191.1 Chromosome partition protein Smc [Carpediemonas membranifera]